MNAGGSAAAAGAWRRRRRRWADLHAPLAHFPISPMTTQRSDLSLSLILDSFLSRLLLLLLLLLLRLRLIIIHVIALLFVLLLLRSPTSGAHLLLTRPFSRGASVVDKKKKLGNSE